MLKNFAHKSDPSATKFDASGISRTIQRALASAGLASQSGLVEGITETINRSLTAAGLLRNTEPARDEGSTFEGTAREIQAMPDLLPAQTARAANDPVMPAPDRETARAGVFTSGSFTCAAGTRAYKVYVPACHLEAGRAPMPLVVMLHGCTQSPEDFAAGTRMNTLADQHGFVVVYPAQCARANASKCWNWFNSEHQGRDRGEPAIIAGITREVAALYDLDPRRIFVAGMSAGAAMAVVLGATYPDLFAAVGAHSGLPYGAAHDMPSAFGAMNGRAAPSAATLVPTIVFHGKADRTVQASNSDFIVRQAARARADGSPLRREVRSGVAADGMRYDQTIHIDTADRVVAEQWVLHGAAHAWSGGSAAGSYTDARGPDASAEMVRFFLSQPRAGADSSSA
jgi:poly(hydroxyalkanoate) depolymerase family esterase